VRHMGEARSEMPLNDGVVSMSEAIRGLARQNETGRMVSTTKPLGVTTSCTARMTASAAAAGK
jgi:hypothetical protein